MTLDALKEAAAAEEIIGFDPSGSSGIQADASISTHGASERAQSWNGRVASRSGDTDFTSTSHSLSSLGMERGYSSSEAEGGEGALSKQYDMGLEEMDMASKQAVLHEMFPSVKEFTISYTLKKSGQKFGRTVEELLNQVFFEEERGANGEDGIVAKAIDGFSEDAFGSRGRKGKSRKRKQLQNGRRASSTPAPFADEDTNGELSTWDAAKKDVEFVCQRTGLPMQTVSSQYHKNGASLPATVRALLEMGSNEWPLLTSDDSIMQKHAIELGKEFPTIPVPHLSTVIRLTHPSTASAHELAKVLTTKPVRNSQNGGIEIITKYSPIDLAHASLPSAAKRTPAQNLGLNLSAATAFAAANTLARQTAFTQASAAYRKSKSDPLMGAAAGYYSSVGRDHDAKVKKYFAAAADALVDSQSSRRELDLHGVSVKDAVRIARERVTAWWVALGDAKVAGASKTEFRIVTGMGRHSEGGRGRLGPAVGKMLVREGWKIEIGEGLLAITGVARKR